MASLNRCEFIGNLGRDPEIKTTPAGKKVANFSIACTESWKDQSGQKQEKTEWINIVVWDKLAEVVERFVKKGSKVFVSGKFQTRSWDDVESGKKRYATEVLLHELIMLDGKKAEAGEGGSAPAGAGYQAPPADDDLPF